MNASLSFPNSRVPAHLTCAACVPGRPLLVRAEGTTVLGDTTGTRWTLARESDRATLTGAVALADGGIVASSLAGLRMLAVPK